MTRRRRPPAKRPSGGFTLIELVSAFVILAVAMGIFMELTASSLKAARRSSDFTHAALWAQIKLDELGVGESLEEGGDAGRFDDRFDYVLDIRKFEPPPATSENGTSPVNEELPIDLFRVELTVRWEDGANRREAKFVTLRANQPDAGAGIGGAADPSARKPGAEVATPDSAGQKR